MLALITPINLFFSRLLGPAHSTLMRIWDEKMNVVTKALQGIRQIKSAALEQQWLAKIGERRAQEIKIQWSIFVLHTLLVPIWILTLVMLSPMALAVYSIMHGRLFPSVAFATIATFR